MLIPHLHFSGRCSEALEFYKRVFSTEIDVIHYDSEDNKIVIHAEMHIHGQRVMFNDRESNSVERSVIKLLVTFDNVIELKKTYNQMSDDIIILDPMCKTSYSPCTVSFIDKFDIEWTFMV